MASLKNENSQHKSSKKTINYKKEVQKIPEQGIKHDQDYADLPCTNTHSLLVVYDDFFKIVGIQYHRINLKQEALNHIRAHYSYYKRTTYKLLTKKKLDLVDWVASKQSKDPPADEICIQACAIMLKIHISIDYTTGCWTTFELSNTHHEYLTALSDIHLMYRGSCKYNLLCKTEDLKTIGHKLLDHKLYNTSLIKSVRIVLARLEDLEAKPHNCSQIAYDSDTTELYNAPGSPTMSDVQQNNPNESNSTDIYEQSTEETSIIINKNTEEYITNKSDSTESYNEPLKEPTNADQSKPHFRCIIRKCHMKLYTRKNCIIITTQLTKD